MSEIRVYIFLFLKDFSEHFVFKLKKQKFKPTQNEQILKKV